MEENKNETLEKFKSRVYSFESSSIHLDSFGNFNTAAGLSKKIDDKGNMKDFMGNTVVFSVKENNNMFRERLIYFQQVLYTMCHRMLSEKLSSCTMHMTVHDLLNGSPEEISFEEIKALGERINPVLSKARKSPFIINLQSTWVFNMVNTSIVLGLETCSQEDWDILTGVYQSIDSIFHLSYPLTPHITLAYFKPGCYSGEEIEKLRYTLKALSEEKLKLQFTEKDIEYQIFKNMNNYFTI